MAGKSECVRPVLEYGSAGDLRDDMRGVTLDFSRPGKPIDNTYIESFNGKFRSECLNASWFLSLDEARAKVRGWA